MGKIRLVEVVGQQGPSTPRRPDPGSAVWMAIDISRTKLVYCVRWGGGEQRRLSLITAFARRPRLLALDEPTYGQDRHGHEALVAALAGLADKGTAMIAATHDERFVRAATARRVELAAGRLVADASIHARGSAAAD